MAKVNKIEQREEILHKTKTWLKIQSLLDNDEAAIKEMCIQWPSESNDVYKKRKENFPLGFINPAPDMVNSPVSRVFKNGVNFGCGEKSSLQTAFNMNVTGTGDNINLLTYMKDYVGPDLNAFGVVYTEIDKKPLPENASKADERYLLPYITNIKPWNVLDLRYGDDGTLLWFAYKSYISGDWANPFLDKKPEDQAVTNLWTRDRFLQSDHEGNLIVDIEHTFGFVPIVIQTAFPDDVLDIVGNSTMEHTVNLIIQSNNLMNGGTHELYKHGSSLLLMPEESANEKSTETTIDGNDVVLKKFDQDGMIIVHNNTDEFKPEYLLKELATQDFVGLSDRYMQYAYNNEKDLNSIAKKGTNGQMIQESGFAKMLDRDPHIAKLSALALFLENWATNINVLIAMILNEKDTFQINIEKEFDLRSTTQKFEDIEKAKKVDMKELAPKIFKAMYKDIATHYAGSDEEQQEMICEIENNPLFEEDIEIENRINEETEKDLE